MSSTLGRRKRQRKALTMEESLIKAKGDTHDKLATALKEKIAKRGEWKFKTKRRLTAAAARSKSKKG